MVKQKTIAIWGLFGQQNLGNECTAQALIDNLRSRLPGAELYLICTDPEEAALWHGLPAYAVSAPSSQREGSGRLARHLFAKLLFHYPRRVFSEMADWWRAFRVLKNADLLLMAGTGMLTDYASTAMGYPYSIYKWTLLAKLRRCKVCFVSVGVGPLRQIFSRWFIRSALKLADYRCYRDEVSKTRLDEIGVGTSRDHIYPDLAFSLPKQILENPRIGTPEKGPIGVGVMDYFGASGLNEDGGSGYSSYLGKTCDFACWLLEKGHTVRILHGDIRYDKSARADLKKRLTQRGYDLGDGRIIDEDVSSLEELLSQLADTRMVISPRFHNLILAAMLGKPVISISYDPKNDHVMENIGLGEYCQPIDTLNVAQLIRQFEDLNGTFGEMKADVHRRVLDNRQRLDRQYCHLLGLAYNCRQILPQDLFREGSIR